jgi:hypothetical protein
MLGEALRLGVRDEAVELLSQADLAPRTRAALGHLGLIEMVETGGSQTGMPQTGGSAAPNARTREHAPPAASPAEDGS